MKIFILFASLILVFSNLAFYYFNKKKLAFYKKNGILFSGVQLHRSLKKKYFFDFRFLIKIVFLTFGCMAGAGFLILVMDPLVSDPILFEKSTFVARWIKTLPKSIENGLTIVIPLLAIGLVLANIFWLILKFGPRNFSRFYLIYQNGIFTFYRRYPNKQLVKIDFNKEYEYEEASDYFSSYYRVDSPAYLGQLHIFSQDRAALAIAEDISTNTKKSLGELINVEHSNSLKKSDCLFVVVLKENNKKFSQHIKNYLKR